LNVTEAGAQYRRSGSAALDLAYVAAGRFDGYFELGLKPWDIAAGELIVKEAGGTVVDARGGSDSMENGQVLACSMKMLKPLMQAVVPAWGEAATSSGLDESDLIVRRGVLRDAFFMHGNLSRQRLV